MTTEYKRCERCGKEFSLIECSNGVCQICQFIQNQQLKEMKRKLVQWSKDMSLQLKQTDAKAHDNVNHPSHYTNGHIECIEAIRAALTEEEFRGYCKGNNIKYVWRERHKGGKESLMKAQWYLDQLINA